MIKSNNKIIIVGTLPPPIGGVSIYNKRLYDYLQNDTGIEVDFIDYKRKNILRILAGAFYHRIIYLNCSSSLFKLFFAFMSRIAGKKFIVTFHGNLERHSRFINFIDRLILKLATLTIVLNRQSFSFASRYTDKLFIGTSFIPPQSTEQLSPGITDLLARCRQQYKVICSSNAHNLSIDKFSNEIYQVRFLLDIFREAPGCCIILSDPSGMYSSYLQANKVAIPPNAYIINTTHSYFELLKNIDVMLRITTTDGDSISVREALYLNKIVIASSVVDRPQGVILVNIDKDEILAEINKVKAGIIHPASNTGENAGEQMVHILKSLSSGD